MCIELDLLTFRMSDSPTFEDKDEAIRYWKQLAEERKNDFDELEEMSKELEKDQDRQIEQLENDNKRIVSNCRSTGIPFSNDPDTYVISLHRLKITFKSLKSQVSRLRTELDDLREKHRERDRTREEELQSTKERLQLTQTEKVSCV